MLLHCLCNTRPQDGDLPYVSWSRRLWQVVACAVMLMRLVASRHAQHAKEAIEDGTLIEVSEVWCARPAEEVAGNFEDVVLCAGLLRLCAMNPLRRSQSSVNMFSLVICCPCE